MIYKHIIKLFSFTLILFSNVLANTNSNVSEPFFMEYSFPLLCRRIENETRKDVRPQTESFLKQESARLSKIEELCSKTSAINQMILRNAFENLEKDLDPLIKLPERYSFKTIKGLKKAFKTFKKQTYNLKKDPFRNELRHECQALSETFIRFILKDRYFTFYHELFDSKGYQAFAVFRSILSIAGIILLPVLLGYFIVEVAT